MRLWMKDHRHLNDYLCTDYRFRVVPKISAIIRFGSGTEKLDLETECPYFLPFRQQKSAGFKSPKPILSLIR